MAVTKKKSGVKKKLKSMPKAKSNGGKKPPLGATVNHPYGALGGPAGMKPRRGEIR